MRKYIVFVICCLCAVTVCAQIPSVKEAQKYASSPLLLNIMVEDAQKEASQQGLYDRYFIRLSHVPSGARKVTFHASIGQYNDGFQKGVLGGIRRQAALLDYWVQYNGNLGALKNVSDEFTEENIKEVYKEMAMYYVRAHVGQDMKRTVYLYEFEYTAYKRDGVTGETRTWGFPSTCNIYYDPVSNAFVSSVDASDTPECKKSRQKTTNYLLSKYTFDEFISLVGIKGDIQQLIDDEKSRYGEIAPTEYYYWHEYYSYKYLGDDPKNAKVRGCQRIEKIEEIIRQNLRYSTDPIFQHNSAIEDKYNKSMFGDISGVVRNMQSSSLQAPSYPGGDNAISSYVQRNLKYPASLEKDGINESASYTITVGANGVVKNVEVDQYQLNYDLKNQTIKLLKNLPNRFTPAYGYGQNVESTYSVNIDYHLDPILTIDDAFLNFPYQGAEYFVRVTSKRDWTFTSPATSGIKVRKDGNRLVITCPERNKKDIESLNDKIIIKIPGTNYSYDITIRQDGAPKPYITPSQTQVNLPRKKKDARYIVTVESNRDWKVQAKNPESKINMHRVDSRLIFTAPTNNSKQNRDATFTLVSTDKDCQKDIVVTQFGRDADKYTSSGTKHSSSFLELYENYYDNYGSFELGLVDLQVGAGCTMPLFSVENGEKVLTTEPYFPLNFEVGYLRFHFVELSLLNFRLDLSTDGKEGFAWEPQIRGLIPVSERWALMPYVGPVCQINTDGKEKSVWSASGGLMARVRYGKVTHTNFSIGYKGGPCGGLAIGVSIGWSLGW